MDKNDIVSVIVPIYNLKHRNLSRCLDSICTQTYTNLEIILIDNGSTDGSAELCQEYAENDSRIKLLHEPRKGVSYARNMGLDNYTGEYICFVDGDDFIVPQYIEKLHMAATKFDCPVVLCEAMRINDSSMPQNIPTSEGKCILASYTDNSTFFVGKYQHKSVWAAIFRRDVIGDNRFDPHIYISEDVLFLARIWHDHSQFVYLTEPLYGYVMYSNSAFYSDFTEKNLTSLNAWQQIEEMYSDCSPKLQRNIHAGILNVYALIVQKIYTSGATIKYGSFLNDFHKEIESGFWCYMLSSFSVKAKIKYILIYCYPCIFCKLEKGLS